MKHFITLTSIIILSFITINVYGQIDYAHPYVEEYVWAFDATPGLGELGFMHIGCDKSGHTWLKHNVHYLYNAEDVVDHDGKECLGTYAVHKGKHIYLKLDNDEIITLTCVSMNMVHNGYYKGSTYVHYKYEIYSYFNIDNKIIEKLKEHQIIKMRCEMKYDVLDMYLHDDLDFNKHYNKFLDTINKKNSTENKQEEINNNPLLDF